VLTVLMSGFPPVSGDRNIRNEALSINLST
jgi:hypothetical protein